MRSIHRRYIFPAMGLAAVAVEARRLNDDDMLVAARRIGLADAARYNAEFKRLVTQASFCESLVALRGAWRRAMDVTAVDRPRQQLAATSFGALMAQADLLNDPLHTKLLALGATHGGEMHVCDVKAEARALQKLHRTYGGEWRRLNDLCRASLVFATPQQMADCLDAMAADVELILARVPDTKMRLRGDFDAARETGGYRDVQLTVTLDTAETRSRGVHEHAAEVQLHLRAFAALKSEGGHQVYVESRNLRGE